MSAMEQRASDSDRQEVVDRLRAGAADGLLSLDEFGDRVGDALGARTVGELDRVVADLPVPAARPAGVPPARARRRVIGVLSGNRVHGRWRPARPTTAVAVLGGCQVDLCDADVPPGDIEIRAVAILGGVEVLVPEGVSAELSGVAVLGAKAYRVRRSAARPGAPRVHVRATAVFGGVTVRTRPFTSGCWRREDEG